jgi:hypothetical protein
MTDINQSRVTFTQMCNYLSSSTHRKQGKHVKQVQTTEEYLKAGGKITQLSPDKGLDEAYNSSNASWSKRVKTKEKTDD